MPNPAGSDIYDDIIKALKDNGELDDRAFRRLVLFALVDLGKGRRDIKQCRDAIARGNERIKKVEKYTILLTAHKHPKTTAVILAVVVLFVATVISRLELWAWISVLLEILS